MGMNHYVPLALEDYTLTLYIEGLLYLCDVATYGNHYRRTKVGEVGQRRSRRDVKRRKDILTGS